MKTDDDNEPLKTQFPTTPKPHVAIGTLGGHRPNLTLLVAMTAAMSVGGLMPPPTPKPPKPEDDSVV